MLRFLLVTVAIVLLVFAVAPTLVPVLTWILAFLSLLIVGDLLLSLVRRGGRRG